MITNYHCIFANTNMITLKHTAIYIENSINKRLILERIMNKSFDVKLNLSHTAKTVLYSAISIEKMIADELKHDKYLIQSENNTALQFMSSGQQRKALLQYLIEQQPDTMVLDDVYSNVDKETQQSILETLNNLSSSIRFIQILFRKRDLLPFIERVYTLNNDLSVDIEFSLQAFQDLQTTCKVEKSISVLPKGYNHQYFKDDSLIELKNVSVKYEDRQILKDINWTIGSGEFWQLVGPNGSGKSTLISMISGDNPKAYGQDMKLFGFQKGSGESIWDIKRHIGYFTPAMIQNFERDDTVENMIISGFNDSIGLYTQPTDIQKKNRS